MKKVTGTIKLSDQPMPEGFDRGGNAWSVELRYEGRKLTTEFFTGSALGEPSIADVLENLAMDASSYINTDGFDGWAAEYGYDTDSRKAFATYQAVERQTRKLETLLGSDFDAVVFPSDPDDFAKFVREPS